LPAPLELAKITTMIYLKNLFKKRILPIVLVVGGIYLIYLAYWSFSGRSKTDGYSETGISDYRYRKYKIYDRMFFDEIHPYDTFAFQQTIPFYFGKNGFNPAPLILCDSNLQGILDGAVLHTSDSSVQAFLSEIHIESQRVKQRNSYKLRFLIELLEEITDLGTGSLSWLGKKTDAFALVIRYSLAPDNIAETNPVAVYLELPGLSAFANQDSLLPVFHPVLSQYEVYEDNHIFLQHAMVYPSEGKSKLWAWLKYAIFIGFFAAFVLLLLISQLWDAKDREEDEDGLSPEKLLWGKDKWAEHYTDKANAALEAGQVKQALQLSRKAIKEGYASEDLYLAAISASLNLQDYAEAERLSDEAQASYPQDEMLVMMAGQVAMSKQEFFKAKMLFDQVLAMDTENTLAGASWFNAAICSAKMGLKKDTLHYISHIPTESYNNPLILKTLVQLYEDIGMSAAATETLHKWLELEPGNSEALQRLGQGEAPLSPKAAPASKTRVPDPQEEALQMLEQMADKQEIILKAKALKEEGRDREVIHLLWPLFEQDSTDPLISLYLAESYNQLEEYGQARKVVQNALKKNPANISLLQVLGQALYFKQETNSALETARQILRLQPHNIIARRLEADALSDLGEHQKAIAAFQELERLDQLSNLNLFNLADCYIEIQEYETAIEYLKTMMKNTGDCAVCWNNIAYCFKKLDLLMDCIDAADRSLEIDPDYAHPLFHKAEAYYSLGLFEEAFELCEKSANLGNSAAAETLADWKIDFEE